MDFYLGLLDQLMELCEQFCNAGISRHEGHGVVYGGAWGGGGAEESLVSGCCGLNHSPERHAEVLTSGTSYLETESLQM